MIEAIGGLKRKKPLDGTRHKTNTSFTEGFILISAITTLFNIILIEEVLIEEVITDDRKRGLLIQIYKGNRKTQTV